MQTKPALYPDLAGCWEAFWYVLDENGTVKLAEILAYCRLVGITERNQRERLVYYLKRMEREYGRLLRDKPEVTSCPK